MARIKVAVLFGGISSEHEVSLVSATNVIQNIPADKYEVVCVGITKKGRWLYYPGDVGLIASGEWEKSPDCTPAVLSPDPIHHGFIKLDGGGSSIQKVDVVFPVLHGRYGEDGTIQGLFELSGVPFVGCNTLSSAICMDKAVTHTLLEAAGIRMARWRTILQSELGELEQKASAIASELGFPLFVKPANCGSSIGINKAADIGELLEAVKFAFAHDKKVVIEEFISGKELECAVFGSENPMASIIGEIVPKGKFYDYEAKYVLSSTDLYVPARIGEDSSDKIRETALLAFKTMGCSGLARVDFFLKADGSIILNELNTLPGFTSISMYPKLMDATGVPYGNLLDKLIQLVL